MLNEKIQNYQRFELETIIKDKDFDWLFSHLGGKEEYEEFKKLTINNQKDFIFGHLLGNGFFKDAIEGTMIKNKLNLSLPLVQNIDFKINDQEKTLWCKYAIYTIPSLELESNPLAYLRFLNEDDYNIGEFNSDIKDFDSWFIYKEETTSPERVVTLDDDVYYSFEYIDKETKKPFEKMVGSEEVCFANDQSSFAKMLQGKKIHSRTLFDDEFKFIDEYGKKIIIETYLVINKIVENKLMSLNKEILKKLNINSTTKEITKKQINELAIKTYASQMEKLLKTIKTTFSKVNNLKNFHPIASLVDLIGRGTDLENFDPDMIITYDLAEKPEMKQYHIDMWLDFFYKKQETMLYMITKKKIWPETNLKFTKKQREILIDLLFSKDPDEYGMGREVHFESEEEYNQFLDKSFLTIESIFFHLKTAKPNIFKYFKELEKHLE
ncbi:MAG: hypothetical protein ACTTJO_01845 [Metamycoplasmataceae bacterium]